MLHPIKDQKFKDKLISDRVLDVKDIDKEDIAIPGSLVEKYYSKEL